MLVLVGGDCSQKALHRQDAGVVLQGVRQPRLHPEAGAKRLVQEACPGVDKVEQVPQRGPGVARQRHANRELHRFLRGFILVRVGREFFGRRFRSYGLKRLN